MRYAVTVEPHGKHWLFALDVPATRPPFSGVRHDLQLRSVRPVDVRVRYEMTSFLDYRFGEKLPRAFHEFALAFVDGSAMFDHFLMRSGFVGPWLEKLSGAGSSCVQFR